jgi:hypothetical protein
MMRMRMPRSGVLFAALFAVSLGACSDGGGPYRPAADLAMLKVRDADCPGCKALSLPGATDPDFKLHVYRGPVIAAAEIEEVSMTVDGRTGQCAYAMRFAPEARRRIAARTAELAGQRAAWVLGDEVLVVAILQEPVDTAMMVSMGDDRDRCRSTFARITVPTSGSSDRSAH